MNNKTLQKLVQSSTVLLLLLGAFWITFVCILYSKYPDVRNVSQYFTAALLIGFVNGILLIIWAILGLIGICKNVKCLLFTYNFGIFVFLLIPIAILVISILISTNMDSYKNDTNCTQYDLFSQLAELNTKSYQTLCQSGCQCDFEGTQLEAQQLGITNFVNSESGPIRVQECKAYDLFDLDHQDSNSDILQAMEETFGCSGFCSKNNYFVFSNINEGIPNGDCKVEVLDFIEDNNVKTIVASSIVTFFMVLCFIFSVFWCCMQSKIQTVDTKVIEAQQNIRN
ncbi:tetraspanin family protein (macronuclear) [Tetrahymena thermophila SB210]|uniref:Tetraspanin family protein n=1 Tax=Tetrahymena thermophila (strain SB210) TaxID=312017 RepID=Q24FE6_TETTS|nr:tetraspanin family protein [Tetrahymena thermophila SB210]EAS06512.1 tetraspanin family protein [Tetrahymena thermophila SB210]|eukprot:XP_001026757.1 tetraspanin family protein [Tetrahymena thermophila SB210]